MKARSVLYKIVVQTVLISWCASWVVTDAMMTVLEGFHHTVDWRLVGLMDRWGNNKVESDAGVS